jgi:formylglycine-generating enzyme required for sulfatase activity
MAETVAGEPDEDPAAAQAQLDRLGRLFRSALDLEETDGQLLAAGLIELEALVRTAAAGVESRSTLPTGQELATWEGWRAVLLHAGRLVAEMAGPAVTAPAPRAAWVRQGIFPELSAGLRVLLDRMAATMAVLAPGPDPKEVRGSEAHLKFDWVEVPAGWFFMGSNPRRDRYASDEEQPQHRLQLPAFRLARVPVTAAQFAAFVRETGYRTDAEAEEAEHCWGRPHGPQGRSSAEEADHPVTCVSWHDVQAFCRWARVRLPTEAEWEKAARGVDGRLYPWGDEWPDPRRCNYGNLVGNTTPVGTYPAGASPSGVLDMAGNVWEWTASRWGLLAQGNYRYPYDPTDGREALEAPDSLMWIVRGGSFRDDGTRIRCAYRDWRYPFYRSDAIGFRVAALE